VYDYKVNTLSFREFLKLKYSINLQKLTLEDILANHQNISLEYSLQIKDIYFKEYLEK
jgi:predicted AAA+ superfamily ATPase